MRGFYRRAIRSNQQKNPPGSGTNSDRSSPSSDPSPKNFPPPLRRSKRKKPLKPVKNSPKTAPKALIEGENDQQDRNKRSPRRGGRTLSRRWRWHWRRFLLNMGIFWVIVAAAGMVAFSLWTGLWLMVDPDSIIWLNQYLPTSSQIVPVQKNPPQTLEAIKAELNQKGFQTAELITFNPDILLPIVKTTPDCPTNCQRISELRLYQPLANNIFTPGAKPLYRLKRQLTISELEESFVIAPLVSAGVSAPGTSKPQPFSSLVLDTQAPKPGVWLHLTGKLNNILYGQIIHYNPQHSYLSVMAEWTSPNGKPATWQQVHGNQTPELLVDRSVGLEPSFRTYQIQPRQFVLDPLWLVEVNFNKAAIDLPAYQNALILARQGLWSEAVKILQPLKGSPSWSETAQTQLELIQLHASVTTTQSKTGWANPSQAILAQLLDGRWGEALDILETINNPTQMQEVVSLLKKDRGQLGERIRVTLQFNPQDTNARIWGALVISTKEGNARAIDWLQYLDQPKELQQNLTQNLKKVEVNNSEIPSQIVNPTSSPNPRLNQYLKLLELGN